MKQIDALYAIVEERELFPYVLFDLKNIRYLTGFTGSNGYLIVDRDAYYFVTDARYEEYARSLVEPLGATFVLAQRGFPEALAQLADDNKWERLYLENHALVLSNFMTMKESVSCFLVPADNITQNLRLVKEPWELELLQHAATLTDHCVEHLCGMIVPGVTEWDVAVEIEHYYRTHGATGTSFDSIVASGANSSMPHYETSMDKKIVHGDTLLIDMGCTYKGYNSDLTRTLFVGDINEKISEIYAIVNCAREKAIEAITPGVTTGELDAVARTIIADAGYGEQFGHSLGHGVGLDIHEFPRVNSEDQTPLPENAVITIEPGIYIPGVGGVRIEDLVSVSKNGATVMSGAPRDIRIL